VAKVIWRRPHRICAGNRDFHLIQHFLDPKVPIETRRRSVQPYLHTTPDRPARLSIAVVRILCIRCGQITEEGRQHNTDHSKPERTLLTRTPRVELGALGTSLVVIVSASGWAGDNLSRMVVSAMTTSSLPRLEMVTVDLSLNAALRDCASCLDTSMLSSGCCWRVLGSLASFFSVSVSVSLFLSATHSRHLR